jgi:hypothetical protein
MKIVAYRAESTRMRDIADVGLVVLFETDIHAFVALKDKYLPFGLKPAIRNHDHPFWNHEGLLMWEEIKKLVNDKLVDGFWFGQDAESPYVVGIFPDD